MKVRQAEQIGKRHRGKIKDREERTRILKEKKVQDELFYRKFKVNKKYSQE